MAEKPRYDHVHVGFKGGGLSVVVNGSDRPEPVLTAQQCQYLNDRRPR